MGQIWDAMEAKTEDGIDFNRGVSIELQRGGPGGVLAAGSGNRAAERILIRVYCSRMPEEKSSRAHR